MTGSDLATRIVEYVCQCVEKAGTLSGPRGRRLLSFSPVVLHADNSTAPVYQEMVAQVRALLVYETVKPIEAESVAHAAVRAMLDASGGCPVCVHERGTDDAIAHEAGCIVATAIAETVPTVTTQAPTEGDDVRPPSE